MYKNFILILFALLFFTGCVTGKGYKCDYYTDNLSIDYVRILVNGKYKQDITGTVCDSQDKRSFIQIKNGLAHGKAEVYLPIGIFVKNNFQNGKLEGISKEYYGSGALQSEANYKNGKKEGIEKFYYESGALQEERNYKNDKKEGISKMYYESGALKSEGNFKNGKLEGILKGYDENGNLTHQTTFKNGLREGQMKSYNSYGKFWATITYKNDKAVSGICANGKKWNNAELSNWENGLKVSCGY